VGDAGSMDVESLKLEGISYGGPYLDSGESFVARLYGRTSLGEPKPEFLSALDKGLLDPNSCDSIAEG
jgi:hypothetical protein